MRATHSPLAGSNRCWVTSVNNVCQTCCQSHCVGLTHAARVCTLLAPLQPTSTHTISLCMHRKGYLLTHIQAHTVGIYSLHVGKALPPPPHSPCSPLHTLSFLLHILESIWFSLRTGVPGAAQVVVLIANRPALPRKQNARTSMKLSTQRKPSAQQMKQWCRHVPARRCYSAVRSSHCAHHLPGS